MPRNRVSTPSWWFDEHTRKHQDQIRPQDRLNRLQQAWVGADRQPTLITHVWFTQVVGSIQSIVLRVLIQEPSVRLHLCRVEDGREQTVPQFSKPSRILVQNGHSLGIRRMAVIPITTLSGKPMRR